MSMKWDQINANVKINKIHHNDILILKICNKLHLNTLIHKQTQYIPPTWNKTNFVTFSSYVWNVIPGITKSLEQYIIRTIFILIIIHVHESGRWRKYTQILIFVERNIRYNRQKYCTGEKKKKQKKTQGQKIKIKYMAAVGNSYLIMVHVYCIQVDD